MGTGSENGEKSRILLGLQNAGIYEQIRLSAIWWKMARFKIWFRQESKEEAAKKEVILCLGGVRAGGEVLDGDGVSG
jgi:hypothetical protein